jgi:hypothetical protein
MGRLILSQYTLKMMSGLIRRGFPGNEKARTEEDGKDWIMLCVNPFTFL